MVGNISEKLSNLDAEGYHPNRLNSLVSALQNSIKKNDVSNNFKKGLELMHPKVIAEKHLKLYRKLNL